MGQQTTRHARFLSDNIKCNFFRFYSIIQYWSAQHVGISGGESTRPSIESIGLSALSKGSPKGTIPYSQQAPHLLADSARPNLNPGRNEREPTSIQGLQP